MNLYNNLRKEKTIALLLDPDKADFLNYDVLKKFKSAGLKYVLIGGSFVSENNVAYEVLNKFNLKKILFPGSVMQLNANIDAILLLSVVSSRNPYYLFDAHFQAAPVLEKLNNKGIEIISTAYMVYDSGKQTSVHYITQSVGLPMDKIDLSVYTALAASFIGMKLIYLDAGSGAEKYVPIEIVSAIRKKLPKTPIFVGGGIKNLGTVKNMLNAGANVVVVGTYAEQNPDAVIELLQELKETINV